MFSRREGDGIDRSTERPERVRLCEEAGPLTATSITNSTARRPILRIVDSVLARAPCLTNL